MATRRERRIPTLDAAGSKLRTAGKKAMARIAAPGPRKTSPSPLQPPWTPGQARYGVGVRHNVAVPMSDGVVLRADVHYPTEPTTGEPAAGPFPVLLSITPYGKKAPPPAAQIGGGATPYLIKRGYIEVMVDVRGTGNSDGQLQFFGKRETKDSVEVPGAEVVEPPTPGVALKL